MSQIYLVKKVGAKTSLLSAAAICLALASANQTDAQQGTSASQANSASPRPEEVTNQPLSPYRVAYYLPVWKTLHLHDAAKAKEQLTNLKKLGCVTQQRAHAGHLDVSFRCNEWKSLAFEDQALAEGWVRWLDANGFDTSLTKLDTVFTVGAEAIQFRLVPWKRIHGDGSTGEAELIRNLQKLGVEVVVEEHGNHNDISFRAPTWRSIRLADPSQADQWTAWLMQMGFETKRR